MKIRLFLKVCLVIASIIFAFPMLILVLAAFSNRFAWPNLIPSEFSLRAFERLLANPLLSPAVLLDSFFISLSVALLSALIALAAARALHHGSFSGKKLISSISILPVIVPATVFGLGSQLLFMQMGINHSVWAVLLSHLIITLPFALRIMLAASRALDGKLEEQARVLGAGKLSAFMHGALPLLTPSLLSAAALSFVLSYSQYFLTMLMGGGRVKTIASLAMPLIQGSDRSISAMMSLYFIGSSLVIFMLFQLAARAVKKNILID